MQALDIHSVAAAIIFVVLYVPFAAWFIRQFIVNKSRVYAMLTLFCSSTPKFICSANSSHYSVMIVHIASLSIQAAEKNLNLVIVDQF